MTQWGNSRQVVERLFIRGRLRLETPAHFGNGDTETPADIALLRDSVDPTCPLLTGASIAGALRNYLREHDHGYGWAENRRAAVKSRAERLFGHLDDADEERRASVLSWLMVDDAVGRFPEGQPTEIRDGVAIDPKTRTAEPKKKYDIELLTAGTTFELGFELWLTRDNDDLREALAVALKGLEDGRIGLGSRKRRGFGQCCVTGWQVWRYSMATPDGLLGWLTDERSTPATYQPNILALLGVAPRGEHRGRALTIDATFEVDGSLLIRSEGDGGDTPDMVHLRSWRDGPGSAMATTQRWARPIVSGTSVAGAIRGRALRIAQTLLAASTGQHLVDGMFGKRLGPGEPAAADRAKADNQPTGSRIIVRETVIGGGVSDRVQQRLKIDRFTGGAYPGALFSQQPLFSKAGQPPSATASPRTVQQDGGGAGRSGEAVKPARVTLYLELRQPHDARLDGRVEAEIGLMLLVLKDLWTGDLPLGGESSVGRGRLRGVRATLSWGQQTWAIMQAAPGGALTVEGNPGALEGYVEKLREWRE